MLCDAVLYIRREIEYAAQITVPKSLKLNNISEWIGSSTMSENYFSNLDGESFMSITTFKRNGQGVATPVWFVVVENHLYLMTDAESWKVKRLKNNPKVELAASTAAGQVTGESVTGTARILPADDAPMARAHLRKKYGVQLFFFALMGKLRRAQNVYIEVLPETA